MKIYTKTGDAGDTSLFGGHRVSKSDKRIAAYGTVDELNAVIGVVRASGPPPEVEAELERVQSDLFDIGAQLASPGLDRFPGAKEERIDALESAIDVLDRDLPPLANFILPGGSPAAAQLHVARTVCRRAERLVVGLGDSAEATKTSIRYLNRLSDYLFMAARFTNHRAGVHEALWKG
jgi:cob(I)alamin adenosyltransferase